MTLSLAILIHSLRFIVVRLSSSMIPIFTVRGCKPSAISTAAKRSQVNLTSSGPCILGLTIYILLVLLFTVFPVLKMSCFAIAIVNIASIIPSKTSLPSLSKIAGLVIRCPTFLTRSVLLPDREKDSPSGFK